MRRAEEAKASMKKIWFSKSLVCCNKFGSYKKEYAHTCILHKSIGAYFASAHTSQYSSLRFKKFNVTSQQPLTLKLNS